jgi:hypothetical protein
VATWEHVIQILSPVFDLMADHAKGARWLEEAKVTNNGQRLAVCLAIDIASGALDRTLAASILDRLQSGAKDAEANFASIQGESTSFTSSFSARVPSTSIPYVRVLELGDFILYYLPATAETLDEVSVERVRLKYLSDPEGYSLGEITAWWSGSRDTVWITSSEDVEWLKQQYPAGEFASTLMDALGLTFSHGVGSGGKFELVAVTYPTDAPVACWQPTALDSGWARGGGFYLSYVKQDNWGRTQSCSGDLPSIRERIHKKFQGLTDDFYLRGIGNTGKPPADEVKLLQAAYERLDLVERK